MSLGSRWWVWPSGHPGSLSSCQLFHADAKPSLVQTRLGQAQGCSPPVRLHHIYPSHHPAPRAAQPRSRGGPSRNRQTPLLSLGGLKVVLGTAGSPTAKSNWRLSTCDKNLRKHIARFREGLMAFCTKTFIFWHEVMQILLILGEELASSQLPLEKKMYICYRYTHNIYTLYIYVNIIYILIYVYMKRSREEQKEGSSSRDVQHICRIAKAISPATWSQLRRTKEKTRKERVQYWSKVKRR